MAGARTRRGKREIKSPQGKNEAFGVNGPETSELCHGRMGLSDPDIRAVLEEIPGFLETSACPQNINSPAPKNVFSIPTASDDNLRNISSTI
jgi:hypothetical protein